ncbi:P110/LppT family adhesin N-terminal domain [Mesomycoplasma bovoculi]|uniref:p102/LppT family protein n=1 Tax=Mesomycoplasma bovoculi M165/69 TaxID=743966 RepID=W5UTV4_9BACT|nr:P110/LppT family adhesin N-terminal domain [Mesomycoplasma bovoculi]AHH45250.1 P102/LppT family protein [Mesomycoplasma bovoculi M165/69]
MKFRNPKTIMALGFSITAIASTVVAVPLALTYFSYSYNSQLDARQLSSTPVEVVSGGKFDQEQFDKAVQDLKIKPMYAQMQVDNALKLDQSGLYSFHLVNAFDFSTIENAGFNVEIDSSAATIEDTTIKNVIVRAYNNITTYTKTVDLKGFATPVTLSVGTSKTLDFEPEKSTITFSSTRFVLPSEFAFMLEDNFQRNFSNSRDLNSAFAKALSQTGAQLNIRNDLNLPTILPQGELLLPTVTINNQAAQAQAALGQQQLDAPVYNLSFANFSDQNGTLAINLEIADKVSRNVKAQFTLNIQNLATLKQVNDAINQLVAKNASQFFTIKQDVEFALNKDKLTLAQMFANNQISPSVLESMKHKGYANYLKEQAKEKAIKSGTFKQPAPVVKPEDEEVVSRAKSKDGILPISPNENSLKNSSPINSLQNYFEVKQGSITNDDPRLANYSFDVYNAGFDFNDPEQTKVKFSLNVTKALDVQSPYLQSLAPQSADSNTNLITNNYNSLTTTTVPTKGTAPYSYNITYNIPASVEVPLYEIKSASTLTRAIPVSQSHSLILASDAFAMAQDLTSLASKSEYSLDELNRIVSTIYLFNKGYLISSTEKTNLVNLYASGKTVVAKSAITADTQDLGDQIWRLISQANDNLRAKVAMVAKDKISFSLVNSDNVAIETIDVTGFGVKSPAFVAANKYRADIFLDARYGGIEDDHQGGQFIRDYTRGDLKFNLNGNTASPQGITLDKAINFESNSSITKDETTNIKDGAVFLAVDLKNLGLDKHYLLTNNEGKGLFIQRILKDENTTGSSTKQPSTSTPSLKVSYILGMDLNENGSSSGAKGKTLALLLSGEIAKQAEDIDTNKGHSYNYDTSDEIIKKNTSQSSQTLNEENNKYNVFVQYQKQNGFDQYAPLQPNSTLVLQIVKSGTGFDIVAQTSASENPSESKLGSFVFSIQDSGKTLNWAKIGSEPTNKSFNDDRSKGKVVFKGIAIFENNKELWNYDKTPTVNEIRQAFVDAFILNK